MNKEKLTRKSRSITYLLRHNPGDLKMDKNGWVSTDDILKSVDITLDELKEIVETNDKQRFSFDYTLTRIRANQGHSINVDLDLKESIPPVYLFHGTSMDNFEKIMKYGGISKMKRQHVHLSSDRDTASNVGKRQSKKENPHILIISSYKMFIEGHKFYLSDNGVWLTDFVPKRYIQI